MTPDNPPPAPQNPVERSVLSEQVKDRLLERIVKGELGPGSRIVETRIAREYGTSQAPVREALRALASHGLVEMRPYKGAWVRRPTREEFVEAVHVRGVLEAYAAELAAAAISEDDIARLDGLIADMLETAAHGDALTQAHKNGEFHGLIVRAAGNATLERAWKFLEPITQVYLTSAVPDIDLVWLARRHEAIVDALKRRDPAAASRETRIHVEQAAELKGRLADGDEQA